MGHPPEDFPSFVFLSLVRGGGLSHTRRHDGGNHPLITRPPPPTTKVKYLIRGDILHSRVEGVGLLVSTWEGVSMVPVRRTKTHRNLILTEHIKIC